MEHIEFGTLIEKFEGRLDARDEHEVAAHIAGCGECRAESTKLADFFAYVEPQVIDHVPQVVTARILNLYQRKPALSQAETNERPGFVSLIFDDWQMAINERYSGLDTRQMLYRIGAFEIDLRLELVGDKCSLAGQIFPETVGATAEISSSTHATTAALNEGGEFTFDPVPLGVYDFRILTDTEDLRIEEVPLHY